MTVNIDTRRVESSGVTEIYISATPEQNGLPAETAERLFSGVRDTLCAADARIVQERVFGTHEVMGLLSKVRKEAYAGHNLDDGVDPSLLVADEGVFGPVAGVQVHAISGEVETEVVYVDGKPRGRLLRTPGHRFITLSGISYPQLSRATDQARSCLEKAEVALRELGVDFLSVARTWMWLGDILSWYDEFNRVRNQFFTERGIIGDGTRQLMPASTGIGLGVADRNGCGMDLFAVVEPADATQYLQVGGKQQCAYDYGSAFSRASQTATPAGRTVFVSGTAAIDAAGATTNIDDAAGQINATIDNVRAVLRDTNVTDDDLVHVIAYCKTKDIERVFNSIKTKYNWPWLTAICDICRPDLLFEIEATALAKKTV